MFGVKVIMLVYYGKVVKIIFLDFGGCGRGRYNIGKMFLYILIFLGLGGVFVCC